MTFRLLACAALVCAVAFLALPVVAIFVDAGPGELWASLDDPSAREALWLSLRTTLTALAVIVVLGTPAAWLLGTRRFRGHGLVTTIVELPIVLPPAVAGIGLLAALGPHLSLTTSAVVVALVFVSAPYYVRQAQAAFAGIDPSWLEASRTLGAGEGRTFARVAVPAVLPALAAGLALAWGRALGEFGATLVFAGSFRGVTQTAPLAIYERVGEDFTGALALSAILVAASAAILVGVRALAAR